MIDHSKVLIVTSTRLTFTFTSPHRQHCWKNTKKYSLVAGASARRALDVDVASDLAGCGREGARGPEAGEAVSVRHVHVVVPRVVIRVGVEDLAFGTGSNTWRVLVAAVLGFTEEGCVTDALARASLSLSDAEAAVVHVRLHMLATLVDVDFIDVVSYLDLETIVSDLRVSVAVGVVVRIGGVRRVAASLAADRFKFASNGAGAGGGRGGG